MYSYGPMSVLRAAITNLIGIHCVLSFGMSISCMIPYDYIQSGIPITILQ